MRLPISVLTTLLMQDGRTANGDERTVEVTGHGVKPTMSNACPLIL